MTPEMRKKAGLTGKNAMKWAIYDIIKKMPEECFDADEVVCYLNTIGMSIKRRSVQNKLIELLEEGALERVMCGVYRWRQHEARNES